MVLSPGRLAAVCSLTLAVLTAGATASAASTPQTPDSAPSPAPIRWVEPADTVADGRYVALGDSFSSGVGAREYYSDSGDCKRSPRSYPVLVGARIGIAPTFVACGGATTSGVINSQVNSVTNATRYVSVSIGGNDAGYGSVLLQCAKPWPTTCWGDIDKAQKFIREQLPGKLDQVYARIRSRAASGAKVAVLGYPRLFNGKTCNLGSRISSGEQKRLNETADLLADTTRGRAQAAGFTFVDSRASFAGHAVCDKDEWINGLSNPISESYHPNAKGYQGFANLVTPALR